MIEISGRTPRRASLSGDVAHLGLNGSFALAATEGSASAKHRCTAPNCFACLGHGAAKFMCLRYFMLWWKVSRDARICLVLPALMLKKAPSGSPTAAADSAAITCCGIACLNDDGAEIAVPLPP